MNIYADKNYYLNVYNGNEISEGEIEKRLKKASSHIDILTYNRIVKRGFENLTKFQKDIIQNAVCELADFEYENEDLIKTALSNYSINEVSMSFKEGSNMKIQDGIAIPKELYGLLRQTRANL